MAWCYRPVPVVRQHCDFEIDIEHCLNCGGRLRIIAAIKDLDVICKIPAHLGLPVRAPPRAPARRRELFEAA